MSKRAELKGIVRSLRHYLKWQATDRLTSGVVAAPEQERQEFEERRRAREKARVARMREALREPAASATSSRAPEQPQSTPPSRPASRPQSPSRAAAEPKKPEKPTRPESERASEESSPAEESPAPWKKFGSRPKPTFSGVGSPVTPDDAWKQSDDLTPQEKLESLREFIGDCTRCGLHRGRKNLVFGVGKPDARLMIVGEGPGYDEDRQGEPFVGRSGELLNQMLIAMGLSREEVYIANVVKCRPPDNRDPAPEEVSTCAPFLEKQVEAVQPDVIVAVGRFASNLLTGNSGSLSSIRGRWKTFGDTPVMPTYHPAYLLRNPAAKSEAWADLKKVMEKLELEIPERYR